MKDLSFIRFFLAILLLLVPPALEFPVIHRHITPGALTLCVITALIITLLASLGGRLVSVKCISEISFIRRHRIECMMAGFMIYFWTFSLIAGWYKPQFKKEYQTLHYENGFAPIFPDTCYHLTHYWLAAVDIPVASDNPVHYADAIRYNARTPLQGSLLPLTRLVWA